MGEQLAPVDTEGFKYMYGCLNCQEHYLSNTNLIDHPEFNGCRKCGETGMLTPIEHKIKRK